MENENLTSGNTPVDDYFEREERCRKAIKTVTKAIAMRIAVAVILVWVVLQAQMELWIWGMIGFVMIINLSGLLPLAQEWKKRRKELKEILAEEE